MRLYHALFALLLMTACGMPAPEFSGIAPTRLTVGQSIFDVRVKDTRASAIRLNAEWAPNLAAVAPRAVVAIERVSGCCVRRLGGDQSRITAWLDCGGPLAPLPRRHEFECSAYEVSEDLFDLSCESYW